MLMLYKDHCETETSLERVGIVHPWIPVAEGMTVFVFHDVVLAGSDKENPSG
jgi:hypothetical protein